MNTQARKLNLIQNLIMLQDDKIIEKMEKMFQDTEKKESISDYKKKILSVSVWTEKDIKEMENNLSDFNTWKIESW